MKTTNKTVKETNLKAVILDFIYVIGFIGLFAFTMLSAYNN